MKKNEKIDYVEFPSSDLEETKRFFSDALSWEFQDYGPDYIAFVNQGLDGGFFRSPKHASTENGSALIVFYSEALVTTKAKIEKAGGKIIQEIFDFPGGRRFHFTDPTVNEYAVWSDK